MRKTSTLLRLTTAVAAIALMPAPASAQLSGLLGKAKSAAGLGTSTPKTEPMGAAMTGDEADAFLSNSLRSTKNVMIAAAIIAQAVRDRGPLTAQKAHIDALNSVSSVKELGAHKSALNEDLAALNARQNLAADFHARYQAASTEEKKLLGMAVANLVIGIARNVDLAGKAPRVVDAIKRNPQLLARAGQFKLAAELVGLQGKGLSGIATQMPKLVSAAKVRAPKDPKTTEPVAIAL